MAIDVNIIQTTPPEIILYSQPANEPDIRINFKNNLFLPGASVYTFIKKLGQALGYLNPDIIVEPSYPDWVINYNDKVKKFDSVITWEVKSMMPAQLGGAPAPGSGRGTKEIKPRYRQTVQSEDADFQVMGQMFDCFIDFIVWDTTASKAETNAQWFQTSFMSNFAGIFGAGTVYFYSRSQDRELLKVNNLLQTRTLTYYVQLAENYAVETKKIQEVKLKLDSQV